MKITKEQYLLALNVVTEYHEQILNDRFKVSQSERLKTREFIDKHRAEMSNRLYKMLDDAIRFAEKHNEYSRGQEILFVEDITYYNTCRHIVGFGKKSWTELAELFDKYLKN